jgi:sugar O-acyltransferase (sialic acid O-acetyltransferase NeuD family)
MDSGVILVVGNGGHARVLREMIKLQFPGTELLITDKPGEEVDVLAHNSRIDRAVIAIGDNYRRKLVAKRLIASKPNLTFPTLVHPRAVVSPSAIIGAGTVVMAGAVVNPSAEVGAFCVINTGSIVEHDCKIGDFSSLATSAALGGTCLLGESSWIGIGACVSHNIQVGSSTVVGAGAVVIDDLPALVLALGVPAKVVRSRGEDESFL